MTDRRSPPAAPSASSAAGSSAGCWRWRRRGWGWSPASTTRPGGPAAQVAGGAWRALGRRRGAERFAARVDVVTYEFENVPPATLEALLALRRSARPRARSPPGRTGWRRSASSAGLGLATAPFAAGGRRRRAAAALAGSARRRSSRPAGSAMTARDRRGSWRPGDGPAALGGAAGAPAILEGLVAFSPRSR
jgi:5-(carboxyamino)imidazole ribonucleotide synthase